MSTTATLTQPSMELAAGEAPKMTNRVELGSQALTLVRRTAAKSLPWPASEDFTGELVCKWLDEAKSVGRPNMVRADWVKAPWIRLEARTYAARILRPALDELVLDTAGDDDEPRGETANWRRLHETDESIDMESEDFTEDSPDGPQWSPVKVRQMAGKLARELHVTDHDDAVYALIQALAPVAPKALAPIFDMSLSAWQGKAKRGAAHIRASYPADHPTINLSKLAREIVRIISGDKSVTRRDTELGARRLGAKLPADSHRNPAQMAREADWLIAQPKLDTRVADAARASADASRTGRRNDADNVAPVAPEPHAWTCPVSFPVPPDMARRLARGIAQLGDDSPRRGPRPSAARAPRFTDVARVPAKMPAEHTADMPGRALMPAEHGAERLSHAYALLADWASAPLHRTDRPNLTTWNPGAQRAKRAAQSLPGHTAMIPLTWLPQSLRVAESASARPARRSLDVAWPLRDKNGRVTDPEHHAYGRRLRLITGAESELV
ncbi:MAG: hypothetical protein ACJ780_10315 [Solirubrobacteraceae bacterium]|jgi:hypothetical protein